VLKKPTCDPLAEVHVKTRVIVAAVAWTIAAASVARSEPMGTAGQSWGTAANGLRIGITPRAGAGPAATAQFDVALENTGAADFVVNLGLMLANGKIMYPGAIRLVLTDPAGRVRILDWPDGPAAMAGRIDDYVVALQAGSIHSLRFTLDKIWSASTNEYNVALAPGHYRIAVRFDGLGARFKNLDMPGIALMNFWKGTVESSTAEFTIAK
jgi:hypothetical protein